MSSKKLHYEAISAHIIVSGCSNEVETSFFSVCLFFFQVCTEISWQYACSHYSLSGKKNTASALVFLCLRNAARTRAAATKTRGYYKCKPPQNSARYGRRDRMQLLNS